MSDIIKTDAVVLSKINYSDTSNIAALFTSDHGKVNVIIKGSRSPKSKIGVVVDLLNHLQIIYYKKDTRDLQLLSDAVIISHYPNLRDDLQKLKYAYAIIEMINNLMAENEVNEKLFQGLIRILSRLDSSDEKPEVTFGRFFLFFLKEIGYEFQIEKCTVCESSDFTGVNLYYNFDKGLICGKCTKEAVEFNEINLELFQYLNCLKLNIPADNFSNKIVHKANELLEQHLKYHASDFKGIQSFQIFKENR